MKKGLYILGLLFFVFSLSYSQNQADSTTLLRAIKKAPEDTGKVKLLISLAEFYCDINPSKSYYYLQQGLALAEKLNYSAGQALSLENIGIYYFNLSDFKKAREFYLKGLKIYENIKDSTGMRMALTNIAIVYINEGDYQIALSYNLRSLKLAESLHDMEGVSRTYNSIAKIYYYKGDSLKVIEYMEKALKIALDLGNKELAGYYYNNLGNVFYSQNKFDKALQNYMLALQIAQDNKNKYQVKFSMNNIGAVYREMGYLEKAMEYFEKAMSICENSDDVSCKLNPLNNIGEIYLKKGNFAKAIECFMQSYQLAKDAGIKENIKDSYLYLASTYAKMKDFQSAYQFYLKYSDIKDTILNETNNKQITEIQTKYDTEKKDNEILLLNKDKKIKNEAMQKQRILIFSFLAGFIIILIFSVFLYRLFLQKKKANIILALQKEEISAQRDEIETQRDKLGEQNCILAEQKKEITDSINYAKRIQQAVLPTGEYAISILGEHFILFKPKDIVSGDFYWGTRINEWLIVTVADCTGHGVPGAFMSVLGVSFLNEIVRKKEITQANQVLEELRISIIDSLQQKGSTQEQKDGMDIVLCVINTNTQELQFSGANNSLIIVTAQKELKELLPDKQPVGIYKNMKSFSNQIIQLQKDDCIYFTSDGFEDQFGGPKNRKFMIKQLKELFVSISDKPMTDQKNILEMAFENWKGNNEQIDDVTILGLKI